jgi:hypothetical protein
MNHKNTDIAIVKIKLAIKITLTTNGNQSSHLISSPESILNRAIIPCLRQDIYIFIRSYVVTQSIPSASKLSTTRQYVDSMGQFPSNPNIFNGRNENVVLKIITFTLTIIMNYARNSG